MNIYFVSSDEGLEIETSPKWLLRYITRLLKNTLSNIKLYKSVSPKTKERWSKYIDFSLGFLCTFGDGTEWKMLLPEKALLYVNQELLQILRQIIELREVEFECPMALRTVRFIARWPNLLKSLKPYFGSIFQATFTRMCEEGVPEAELVIGLVISIDNILESGR